MTTYSVTVFPKLKVFVPGTNQPAVGYILETKAAGTNTPLATYTDSTGGTPNPTEIALDANGEAHVWLSQAAYKFVLKTPLGATVAGGTVDNIRSDYGSMAADLSSPSLGKGASTIAIQDAGNRYTSTNVEGALQEVPAMIRDNTSNYALTTGTSTAYVAALTPTLDAYRAGLEIILKIHTDSGNAPTLNVDGRGALNLLDGAGNRLTDGQLQQDCLYTAVCNGAGGANIHGLAYTEVRPAPRHVIQYQDGTHVYIRENGLIQMSGFRFQGQFTKRFAPSFPPPQQLNIVGTLGAEDSAAQNNWYGVFACADTGDGTCSFRIMPFLRAGSVAGSTVTLNAAGEAIHTVTPKSYIWSATDNLAGTDCLVINETIDGRPGNFSGRVTTITANNSTSVTLGTIGSIAAYDFLLPAPPGFDHYRYLGSFLFDASGATVELRNIADSGTLVKGKMVNNADPDWTTSGSVASYISLDFRGYISPLATAVVLIDKCTLSTASDGTYTAYFATDSSDHYVHTHLIHKEYTGPSLTHYDSGIVVTFSFGPFISFKNAGGLAVSRVSNNLEIQGYVEP